MVENRLKLNEDKTEVLLCGSSCIQKAALIEHIQVGESQISLSASIWDVGLVINANLDMTAHIGSVDQVMLLQPQVTGKTPALSDS